MPTAATARKLHWSGAIGKSEADELALDIEFARRKCRQSLALTHFLELNERRLSEMLDESPVNEQRELGMCGCGRPRAKDHGRCWYIREQSNGQNGGTAVKEKRKDTKRAIAPSRSLNAPVAVTAVESDVCEFSIRITGLGYDMQFTGTTIEGLKRVVEKL